MLLAVLCMSEILLMALTQKISVGREGTSDTSLLQDRATVAQRCQILQTSELSSVNDLISERLTHRALASASSPLKPLAPV